MAHFFLRKLITTLLIILISIFLSRFASGAEIRLQWDPNSESDLSGYKVYYGTGSGSYGTPINVGNVTTYALGGLTSGQTYFIAVKAYDTSGYESGFSNEVSGTAYDPETVSAPNVLSGPTSGITGTSYSYTTGGSSSNLGHSVQYQFDWKGDGSDLSAWGSATQSKTWTAAATYNVRSRARCATHTTVVSSWSSSLAVTINPAPQSITVTTNPSSLQITVDSVNYTAPQTFSWTPGSSHTLSVASPQSGSTGTRYAYSSWSDGGAQTHTITAPSSATTYTANFTTQYSLTTSAAPSAGGTVTPSGTNWYNSGQSVSVSATANTGYTFQNWSGDLTGSTNPTSITMNAPKSVAANFETISTPTVPTGPTTGTANTSYTFSTGGSTSNLGHTVEYQFDWKGDGSDLSAWGSATQSKTWTAAATYNVRSRARCATHTNVVSSWSGSTSISVSPGPQSFTVTTNPSNPSAHQITVDDVNYTAPQTFTWIPGSTHKLSVSSPQDGTSGVQYVYSSWSDGGAQTHNITVPSSATTYTANFTTQYTLTTSAAPSVGGTVSPSGTNWYNSGQSVSVSATANAGYTFANWSGDLSGSSTSTSISMNGPKNVVANFESITAPTVPVGPATGNTNTSYDYSTAGSTSNLGHTVEYQFDWKGDGTDLSAWGSVSQPKAWSAAGTYNVRARARCTNHTSVVSSWSGSTSVTISSPAVSHTVTTNPTALQITVDNVNYTAPYTFSWTPNSSHTLYVSSPQAKGQGIQYLYTSWSDGGGQSHTVSAPSSSASYTASFKKQHKLKASVNISGAGTVSANSVVVSSSDANWYDSNQTVSIQAIAASGYGFSNWSGDLSGTANPVSLNMDAPKDITAIFVQIPGAATLISPSGTITTSTPTYTWNAVSGATLYYLQVNDSTGVRILQWYTASEAGCDSGTGTCSVTPTTALAEGSGSWWIQTKNAAGTGPWSSAMSFKFSPPPPAAATLVSPSGTITTARPTYIWNAVAESTWYYLSVNDSTGNKILQWYTPAQANCGTGTGQCSVTPGTSLVNGAGSWKVQTYNGGGYGPWSAPMSFTVNAPQSPTWATLVSPSGSITNTTPSYTWNAVFSATDYLLWVNDATGNKIQKWYTAVEAGCGSGTGQCSVTPSTALPGGSYTWWIQTKNGGGTGPWSSGMSFAITPPATTLVSPSGTITTATPTYTWNAVSTSTWYYLSVNDANGNRILQWYTAAQAGCGSGTGTCSITPTTPLSAAGAGQWKVQTWNSGGFGPWSAPMSFYADIPMPPAAATLISPSGTVTKTTLTYTWNAVPTATDYLLWVGDSTGNRIQTWYTAAAAGCGSGTGTCSVTPSIALTEGPGTWWILTKNGVGNGPWSSGKSFTIQLPPPTATTLVSPSGTFTIATPTYVWNAVPESTWYYLSVNDANGNRVLQWYTAAQAGCGSGTGTCSVTPTTPLAGGAGQWKVQTWNRTAFGPWSASMPFYADIPAPPPGTTMVSPSGTISTVTPTYKWNAVSAATEYLLWVNDTSGNRIQRWYTASDAGCASGTGICSVTPTTVLAQGSHTSWVQTKNGGGTGPWSSGLSFTISGWIQ